MLQFLIVCSGTTEFDRQGRVLGNLDVPLHADATRELEEIVDRLRGTAIDAVYAGPGQSAVETAERVCEPLEMKFKSLESLQNINLGLWQGLLLEEVKRKQPKVFRQWQENPETICPPEGEMLQAARDRIDFFLNRVYKKHKSGSIMVVVAEPLAALLVSVLEQSKLKDISQTRNDGDIRVQRISPVLTNVS